MNSDPLVAKNAGAADDAPRREYLPLSHPPFASRVSAALGLPEPALDWRARFGDGQGKDNQTSSTRIFNHHGTHIDAPLHVFPDGRAVDAFPIEHFVFDRVVVASCPEPAEAVAFRDIAGLERADDDCELLVVKTGLGARRHGDPEGYAMDCPGFAAEAADALRRRFPRLRALGFDMFGVERVASGRARGWPVHKAFLKDPPLLLIEDMLLDGIEAGAALRVVALPLLIPAEAAPATVLAELLR